MTVDLILTLVVTASAVIWAGFLVSYSVHAKWWRNPVGRNAFGVSAILFLILMRISLARWFPEVQQRTWAAILVFGLAGTYGLQRWRYMRKAQREVVKLMKVKEDT